MTVSGNDLVVKMADGTIRNFENVPASARVTVDGKQLGIHDLKPGMKLQRTITTTTTPMTITTVQTVKGKVWAITPPLSIILTLEDGKNQQFKIPEDQKFNVDGQMVDAWGVRKGMIITATKIVEQPATEVTQEKTVTGRLRHPPDVPILVAVGSEEAVPAPQNSTSSSTRGRKWFVDDGDDRIAVSRGGGCRDRVVCGPEAPLACIIFERISGSCPFLGRRSRDHQLPNWFDVAGLTNRPRGILITPIARRWGNEEGSGSHGKVSSGEVGGAWAA